jgi:hypothetical protein
VLTVPALPADDLPTAPDADADAPAFVEVVLGFAAPELVAPLPADAVFAGVGLLIVIAAVPVAG